MNCDLPRIVLEKWDERTGILFRILDIEVEFESYPAEPDVGIRGAYVDYISLASCTLNLVSTGDHTFKVDETKTKTLEKLTERFESELEDMILEELQDEINDGGF